MALTTEFGTYGKYYMSVDLTINSQSQTANTSNVTVVYKVWTTYGNPVKWSTAGTYSMSVNGSVVKSGSQVWDFTTHGSSNKYSWSWTGDVSHNVDGTLSLPIRCSITMPSNLPAESLKAGVTYSVSGSIDVTTINRQFTLTISQGANTTITVTRGGAPLSNGAILTYGDVITVSFSAGTNYNLESHTLNGSTFTNGGAYTVYSNVTVASTASRKQSVITISSATVADVNFITTALTGNSSVLIKGYSTARVSVSVSTTNGAKINGVVVNNSNASVTPSAAVNATVTFVNNEYASFEVTVTDDYGNSVKTTVIPTIIDYARLTSVPSAKRDTPTGDSVTLTLNGIFFNSSFGATANTLTARYRSKQTGGSYGSWTNVPSPTKSGGKYTASVNLTGFTYTNSYSIEVDVRDSLLSLTTVIDIPRGVPVFDWGDHDFRFNVPTEYPIRRGIALADGTDLNTVTTCGTYYSQSSSYRFTNSPVQGAFKLIVDYEINNHTVVGTNPWQYCCQYIKKLFSNVIYYRSLSTGENSTIVYGDWQTLTGASATAPVINAVAGSNIGVAGTPTVTASTSGNTTTFTFNYLKGEKGDAGNSTAGVTVDTVTIAGEQSENVWVTGKPVFVTVGNSWGNAAATWSLIESGLMKSAGGLDTTVAFGDNNIAITRSGTSSGTYKYSVVYI